MSAASPPPPNYALPKFDSTLGALYVGSGVATILYGVSCLQAFIYATSPRTRSDRTWLKLLVLLLLYFFQRKGMEAAGQATMMAGMYRFLVTDFLNPLALPSGGPGSGEVFIYAMSVMLACTSVMIQMFFCWRIWVFSASSFEVKSRIAFAILTVSLSLFSFATCTDLAITGFNHRLLTGNTPDFVLAFKLATSSQVAYDVIVTCAMSWSLHRARVGIKRTDNVVKLIMLFTINTNLLTTIISIAELITFLTLPHATVYGGIAFMQGRTYFNSFLAVLNAREYLREKFDNTEVTIIYPESEGPRSHGDTEETTTERYEVSTINMRSSNKEIGMANDV